MSFRRKSIFPLILFSLLLFSGEGLHAQRYFSRTYTEADGLSSSMVYDVVQDSTGQIWLATRTGISCYTGIRFINYNSNNGLKTSSYGYLAVDSKGGLWTLPLKGEFCILEFTDNRWKPAFCDSAFKISASYTAFDAFYIDNHLVLAAGTNLSGALICKGGKLTQYTAENGLPSNKIYGITGFGDAIYLGTEKGLAIIRDGVVSVSQKFSSPYLSREILAITEGPVPGKKSETAVWMMGNNWLGFLSKETFHLVTSGFNLPTRDVGNRCFISVSKRGDIIFGNPIYVYCFSEVSGDLILFDRKSGLITNGGTAALTDREDNLWITGYRGITKIPSMQFRQFSDKEGLYNNEVASGLEMTPGHYVFGHHGALTFYDGSRFSHFKLPIPASRSEFEVRVQDLDIDREGNLWMAVSTNGVGKLDRDRKVTWYQEDKGLTGTANSVLITSEGNIYAGTNKGLFEYKNGRFFKRLKAHACINRGIRKIFEGPDAELYLATFSNGLIRISGDTVSEIRSREVPLANDIYAVFFDRDNRSWVGTTAGLFTLRDSILCKIDTGNLVVSRPVYLILEDSHGCLWFGTDNGVYRWKDNILDHFTVNEGFSGLEVNRDAGFQDHVGHIWFGTNNGITQFQPEYGYNSREVPPPIVRLLYIEAGEDTLNPQENLVLPARRNNLVFHFDVSSYIDESQVFYRCKLEGFDDQWSNDVFARNNSYRFNNLPPGTYRFYVKAKNSIGTWSEPVWSGPIRIKHPFWVQWWFIALALTGAFGLLFILTRLVIIKRYNLSLAKMVAIRTRDLRRSEKDLQESNEAKDNFFSIIAHDLKSPFNAILGMLDLLTTEYGEFSDEERHRILVSLKTASTRTIDLLENLLTWAQAQKGLLPFTPEKFDLMELIKENVSLFEPTAKTKRINLLVTLSENALVYGDRNMINTAIRNLISNAIKFTYPDGDVSISIRHTKDQQVMVSITDNGCGMTKSTMDNLFILDKRTTTKGTANETGTGLGLILSKDFITKNDGKIWVESQP